MAFKYDSASDDPLTLALKPPADETPEQHAERVEKEREATRVSEEIDKELEKELVEKRKNNSEIKVLLLGPSGSGKSTTLKNFQLAFTPKALQAQAENYIALIYLNVVSSLRLLLDVINETLPGRDSPADLQELKQQCSQLSRILEFETTLSNKLWDTNQVGPRKLRTASGCRTLYEVVVHVSAIRKLTPSSKQNAPPNNEEPPVLEQLRVALIDHRRTIESVANHPMLEDLLKSTNHRQLSHIPGYFLDDLERITTPDYSPTDDDILRTRLRTLGVSETRFKVEEGPDKGLTWAVYDVGGARYQRASWVPYFDDVQTIIFVAPVGHFDQFLEEAPSINCLKDTFDLWDSIVSSKLLARADIILFLNKYDILDQKLKMGINFASYVTSYKDLNNKDAVGKYLKRKFTGIHQQRSPNSKRVLHVHFTSVTVSTILSYL
ncbi:hypothetical protein Clacol_004703 [Clathrus columnatus]|uniref:Uncharacterized protein n=1 Tax=Clathrus columnatus TaxID=1419009 RepID=A0AAV5A9U3_9AGAM|nr:hypothetical protein Clacol_004703 [Clathrus columnatus]